MVCFGSNYQGEGWLSRAGDSLMPGKFVLLRSNSWNILHLFYWDTTGT